MKLVARLKLDDVRTGGLVRVPYPPFDVLVVWADGEVYAIEDACNHAGASLSEGWVDDACITCPMHGYVFDLATGQLVRPKGLCSDQRTYEVRVEGDEVAVYDTFDVLIRGP